MTAKARSTRRLASALGAPVALVALAGPSAPVGATPAPVAEVSTSDRHASGPVAPPTPRAMLLSTCSYTATFRVTSYTPGRVYSGSPGQVRSNGRIEQSPARRCGGVHRVLAQTKACGLFGCNYETKRTTTGSPIGTNELRTAEQGCRSGTHRYRTFSTFDMATLDGSVHRAYHASSQPEFTCTSGKG